MATASDTLALEADLEPPTPGWTTIPAIGVRYWAALSLASVAGADAGDLVSRRLGLGYWHGLPPLALLFAATMLVARRAPKHEAWYWVGIVIVRTAATNLADLQSLDVGVPMPLTAAVFLLLLAVVAFASHRSFDTSGLPIAGGHFWAAMLAVGTLGTVCGDDLAFGQGIGPPHASVLTTALFVVALLWRATSRLPRAITFWTLVTAIRCWGTNVGDMTSDWLGLVPGAVVSFALFAGLLAAWRPAVDPERKPVR